MRRVLSILLVVSVLAGTVLPIQALADDWEQFPSDTSTELDDPDAGISLGLSQSDAAEPEEELPEEPAGQPAVTPAQAPASPCADPALALRSGFEPGGGIEFYTRIRLTAVDRAGNPVEGAVYMLNRMDNGQTVAELTTDKFGVAITDDLPVDTDYMLMEISAPEGYLPNHEHYPIHLMNQCTPSRVDVKAVYDRLLGKIGVIKTDPDGQPLPDVGFYVYREPGRELVDTLFTGPDGKAISTDLPLGQYTLYEFQYPVEFAGDTDFPVLLHMEDEVEWVTIQNQLKWGNLRIYKRGDDGRSIQDAVFSIFRAAGDEFVADISTSHTGNAYLMGLPLGDYYVKEKSVPAPYVLNPERFDFSLEYQEQSMILNVENKVGGESGRLRIIKTDDSGNPLSGVKFALYRTWDRTKITELTTGADGIAEYFPLVPQDYYLHETVGKDGYTMVTGTIPFTVDGSGAVVEVPVVNPKIRIFGKVRVIKKDDAGAPIPGVRFGVYCQADKLLEELVTGTDGSATSELLNEGDGYYLQELEGAAGYLPSDEKYPFAIVTNNVTVPVNVTNPRISGGIKVIKTGHSPDDEGETGAAAHPLAGVVFGVYKDGKLVDKLTTGEDGVAESGVLYYGGYELVELSTVEGYELLDTPIPFSILEQDVVLEIPVANPLILGRIVVYKVDENPPVDPGEGGDPDDGNPGEGDPSDTSNAETPDPGDGSGEQPDRSLPLAGAVFGLYNKQGQKLAELVTGEDGSADYTLPQGEYFLKELAAPESYIPTDELIPFAIDTQAQVVEKTVANTRGFGVIRVVKSGEDEELLERVAFDVYRTSTDEKVGGLLTDENGTATLELPLGRYYLVETAAAEGYLPLAGRISFHLLEKDTTVTLPIANQRQPIEEEESGVRLLKRSATDGAPLPLAVFEVFPADSEESLGELVTGRGGAATIALPAGEYRLVEKTPPAGFLLSETPIPVVVVDGAVTEVIVENTPEPLEPVEDGELRIIKHANGTGERLPGARFGLFDALTDRQIGELTTDAAGIASQKLPVGDYYLLELEAPAEFRARKEPLGFPIVAGETQKLMVGNDPEEPEPAATGTVEFIKEAKDTKEKLAGAVIGVYSAGSGEKVAELTTGTDGSALYKLAAGEYTWKELRSPAGYALLEGSHTFSVAADKAERITVANTPLPADKDTGSFRLVKKAAGTGQAIPDTVFGIYTKANRKVAELTTDDGGEAELALEPGDYYLVELSAPAPYVLETTKIPFTVKETGKEVLVELSNTRGVGTLRVEKKDTDGKLLPGAVFSLRHADGKRIAELTVGQDGYVAYDLPAGAYSLVEKAAPSGYTLDAGRHDFLVSHQKTSTVTVINEPLQGTVKVYFRHVDDKRELAEMVSLTDRISTDYVLWMRRNGYENKPIEGYTLVGTDYPSSLVLIDGVLEVTLWYDGGDPVPGTTGIPGGDIPKTGIPFPYGAYGLSLLCWIVAAGCAFALLRLRRRAVQAACVAAAADELEETVRGESIPAPSSEEPASDTPQVHKVAVRRIPRDGEQ